MRLLRYAAVAVVIAGGARAHSATPSGRALSIAEPHARHRDVYQHDALTHRYVLRNDGERPVRILEGIALVPGGNVTFSPDVVPAGGAGEVVVHQPVESRLGLEGFRFAIETDDGRYRMSLTAFVQSAFEPEAPLLDFGTVERGSRSTAQVEIGSREVDHLEAEVLEAPSILSVSTDGRAGDHGEAVVVTAALRPDAPLGLQTGTIRLRTNVPNQRIIDVPYAMAVWSDVVPGEHPLALGLVRSGAPIAHQVVLKSRRGLPVEVRDVVDPAGLLRGEAERSSAGTVLHLSGRLDALGTITGRLDVFLAGRPEPLPLSYRAVVVAADTRVRDVDLSGEPESDADAAMAATEAPPPPPAPAADVPAAPGSAHADRVTLTWKAATEEGVYGYLVFRSLRREGPFVRASELIIPSAATPSDPGAGARAYAFVDRDVAPGKTYYYYLDVVSREGIKQRFSGVISKQVGAPAGGK